MLELESSSKYLETTITVASSVINYLRENQDELHSTDYERKLFNFRIDLYENMTKLAKSFFKLVSLEEESFSILALGSLARSVFEVYRPFYYLTIDSVDEDSRNFRMLIFLAYGYIENANLIKALGGDITKTEISSNLRNLKKQIRENNYFKSLTSKSDIPEQFVHTSFDGADNEDFSRELKRKIVDKNGCFKKLEVIISERVKRLNAEITNNVEIKDIENRFAKFFYKLFSNYVHSSALAISQTKLDDFESLKHCLEIMISSVIFCLYLATEDISELYPSTEEIIKSSEFQESLNGMLPFVGNLLGKHQLSE